MRNDVSIFEKASQLVVESGMQFHPLPQRFKELPQSGFRVPFKQDLKLFYSLQWLAVQWERQTVAHQVLDSLPRDYSNAQCLQHIVLYRLLA